MCLCVMCFHLVSISRISLSIMFTSHTDLNQNVILHWATVLSTYAKIKCKLSTCQIQYINDLWSCYDLNNLSWKRFLFVPLLYSLKTFFFIFVYVTIGSFVTWADYVRGKYFATDLWTFTWWILPIPRNSSLPLDSEKLKVYSLTYFYAILNIK